MPASGDLVRWFAGGAGWLGLMLAVSGCLEGAGGAPAEVAPTVSGPSILKDDAGDAPRWIDALAGRVTETATSVDVEIVVADLPEGLLGLAAEGYSYLVWEVCWNPTGRTSPAGVAIRADCAGVAADFGGEAPDVQGFYELNVGAGRGCNYWEWCSFEIPHELVAGAPATLRASVPKGLLPNSSAGAVLESPALGTVAVRSDPAFEALGHRSAQAYVFAGGLGTFQQVPPFTLTRDASRRGPDVGLELPFGAITPSSRDTAILRDPRGDVGSGVAGNRPDLDITAADLHVTATSVAVVIEVADLGPAPTHQFYGSLGVGDVVYEFWHSARAGQVWEPGGGYCADVSCDSYPEYVPTVEFHAGAPGTIELTLPRSALPPLQAGQRVNLADFYLDEGVGQFQAVPSVGSAGVWAWGPGDWAWGALPYDVPST